MTSGTAQCLHRYGFVSLRWDHEPEDRHDGRDQYGPTLLPNACRAGFAKEAYTDGFVQFADAVQRAEFQPVRRTNWYTVLNLPTMFAPVKIQVPSSVAEVFQLPDRKISVCWTSLSSGIS